MISALVTDARTLIAALEGVVLDAEQADAVGLLALIAGQDVEPGNEPGSWRIAQRTAPDRVVSVVDPESRHVHKTVSEYRDGYKGHIAVEPETGLVTDTLLTPGNTPDAEAAIDLLADEQEPVDVLGDSAYGSGKLRAKLNARGDKPTSKRSRCARPFPAGSPSTTSTSTPKPRRSPVPPGTPLP